MAEIETALDFQQLVKEDMDNFLASGQGRLAYADAVFRRPEAMAAATELVSDYLH